jgi:dsDNA-specific endonuclease/ATPase MutS2
LNAKAAKDAGSVALYNPHRVPIEREIDLHTFAPKEIPSVVEEYVNAAVEAGLTEVRVIHGRGRGVQRGIVQAALERHPLVVEFWDDTASHLGATMAALSSKSAKAAEDAK